MRVFPAVLLINALVRDFMITMTYLCGAPRSGARNVAGGKREARNPR
jgi:hypothetical protein